MSYERKCNKDPSLHEAGFLCTIMEMSNWEIFLMDAEIIP